MNASGTSSPLERLESVPQAHALPQRSLGLSIRSREAFVDYFQQAFGGFSPQSDEDAAAKFALHAVIIDAHWSSLEALLTEGSHIGGIEGVPGWTLERRDAGSSAPGYSDWPAGATYRAFVDPEVYRLKFPEGFYNTDRFHHFVKLALDGFVACHPERKGEVLHLRSFL